MLPARRIYPVGEYLNLPKAVMKMFVFPSKNGTGSKLKVIKHIAHWQYKFILCNNFRETTPSP